MKRSIKLAYNIQWDKIKQLALSMFNIHVCEQLIFLRSHHTTEVACVATVKLFYSKKYIFLENLYTSKFLKHLQQEIMPLF